MKSVVKSKNDLISQAKNKKDCEKAFNSGWPILYAAEKLSLNKNTVNKYYRELRDDMAANMDKEFISEQKYHKAHAMRALQTRMETLEEQLEKLEAMREESMKNAEMISLERQITTSLMALSELEQQMHALGMSRTVDISIRKIVEASNGKSGANDIK